MKECMSEKWRNEWMKDWRNQWRKESFNQSSNESINQWVNEWMAHSTAILRPNDPSGLQEKRLQTLQSCSGDAWSSRKMSLGVWYGEWLRKEAEKVETSGFDRHPWTDKWSWWDSAGGPCWQYSAPERPSRAGETLKLKSQWIYITMWKEAKENLG